MRPWRGWKTAVRRQPEMYLPCDICGNSGPRFVLEAPALDGPLVRCPECGLHYIGERRSRLAFGSSSSEETANRVIEANLRFAPLALDEERRLADLNARWRLELIRRYVPSGRLLEIGCARGNFLKAAREWFAAYGVEPSPELAAEARQAAVVHHGVVDSAPWSGFDVAAAFHVIEHSDRPAQFVEEIHRRLRPGGLLVIETPNIRSLAYRLMGARWRQFIPEHYYFFDRRTLRRLLEDRGFKIQRTMSVGKIASVELILNRLSRYHPLVSRADAFARILRVHKATFRVNPFDIMLLFAMRSR